MSIFTTILKDFCVPNNYTNILELMYGPDWTIEKKMGYILRQCI